MDDFSRKEARFAETLSDLRRINSLLGGYRSTDAVLAPLLEKRERLRFVDLGCGGGDLLEHVVRRGADLGCCVDAVGIDANPAIVTWAHDELNRRLPPRLRDRIQIEQGDALDVAWGNEAFDVAHAALFLHHFHDPESIELLDEMQRVSSVGIVVNDLHRHFAAYAGIWAVSRVLRMSPMVQHDGPVSVRRGFTRSELQALAHAAGLPSPSIRWHWAFRWTLSTVSNAE